MTIRRRDTRLGKRWDVEWLLPDGTKRSKTFTTRREAKLFEGEVGAARHAGGSIDPRGGKTELAVIYKTWLASRPDLSPKVRRGYEDNWRLRIGPAFGNWPIERIERDYIQEWVNGMTASGLSPRTVRWTHSVLKMVLDQAIADKKLYGKNPSAQVRFAPLEETSHVYLTPSEVTKLTKLCGDRGDVVMILAYTGLRFGELTGLNVEDIDIRARRIRVRRSITQVSGRLISGPTKSRAGRRNVPIPEKLLPILEDRLGCRGSGEPAITSPMGARLGIENWKRSVQWRKRIVDIGRPTMRVHDLRHTYASLARSAGADLKLLQVTMGHASITVTAHTYADLYDSDLDRVADAMDGLGE